MIVSQIALPGIGPHSESWHMVLLHNLESVPLSFGVEFHLNRTEYPLPPSPGALLDLLKGALTVYAVDAVPKPTWQREGDLLWTSVRRTIGARRSGRVMLEHKKVSSMSGQTPVCGTVGVTLPTLAVSMGAQRKLVAQLDHPAHVLVTVFDHIGWRSGPYDPAAAWPRHLALLMPPVGGSREFLIPPEQPPAVAAARKRRAVTGEGR